MDKIYFSNSTKRITSKKDFLYQGQVIDGFFGGQIDFSGDSIADALNSEVANEIAYSHPLSTRMIINLEFRTAHIINSESEFKDVNAFFLTYVQGLRNFARSTTVPYFSAGYRIRLFDRWNIGASAGYGGFNRFTIGAFTSVGIKHFQFGIGSSNLAGWIYKKNGTGVNVNVNRELIF